jgi:glycine hydroxymethyltransferase
VPYDDKSPFITSGIRVGVPAVTTRGLKEEHMPQVADWLDKVLMHTGDDTRITRVKEEVNEFMTGFPLYPEWA